MFPQAKPYYDMNHVISEIDGKFYDITGRVMNTTNYEPMDYEPKWGRRY